MQEKISVCVVTIFDRLKRTESISGCYLNSRSSLGTAITRYEMTDAIAAAADGRVKEGEDRLQVNMPQRPNNLIQFYRSSPIDDHFAVRSSICLLIDGGDNVHQREGGKGKGRF